MAERITVDVLIIGGGPAGLTAAAELAGRIDGSVLVLEREHHAGGIPRHSDHLGYGVRDMHRMMRGPAYAQQLVRLATQAGAVVRADAMVTSWSADGSALVTTPQGRLEVAARAVVLATGARERARPARLIAGDRPAGIYTTGQLQNLVHLHHGVPGQRAVVVGAELVSWSAVLTLREAGCSTVLMTTTHPSPESYAAFNLAGRALLRTPVAAQSRVVAILGTGRVRAVEIEHVATGKRTVVECDTVVFTGDWIPDNELARQAGLAIDPGTHGPAVDTALRTSHPGIFAIGNLTHPVDTADVAALSGRHVAAQVLHWLNDNTLMTPSVTLTATTPLRWVSPNVVRVDDPSPARDRLLLWTDKLVRRPTVVISQRGRVIARRRIAWSASPGRVFRVPSSILDAIDFDAGDVSIALAESRR